MSSPSEAVTQSLPRTNTNISILSNLPAPFASAAPTPTRSLARAVYERRDEYLTKAHVRIKIGSWNVASLHGTEKDLKSWFVQGKGVSLNLSGLELDDQDGFETAETAIESARHQEQRVKRNEPTVPLNDPGVLPGDSEIGLYVLGLQEIVDIASATGALRPYSDPSAARKWKDAVVDALPAGYKLVAEQQLIGLYLVIFASATVAKTVTSVSTSSVGTGLMGYMGNKGAVAARLVLGESTKVVFINSHLAAGHEKASLERRNWDAAQITQRTKFDPVDHGNGIVEETGDSLGAEDYAFWFGDLNYRLGDLPGEDVRRLLMLHTKNEYDTKQESLAQRQTDTPPPQPLPEVPSTPHGTSTQFVVSEEGDTDDLNTDEDRPDVSYEEAEQLAPEDDPASLQTTIASLLPHDQLHEQMRIRKAFYEGWREGAVKFLPTYKYDVGSVGQFDSSEKRRGPSWCDRILFRTQHDYNCYIEQTKQEGLAKKRDEEMKARGLEQNTEETVLFDYNPDTDGTESMAPGISPGLSEPYDPEEDDAEPETRPSSQSSTDDSIQLQYYTSHQRILSSDHKPLDAIFDLTYTSTDYAKKAEITGAVAKEFDRDENEARPSLTLIVDQPGQNDSGRGEIDFGRVRYDEPKSCNITIANTGSVVARFGLVQDVAPEACHRWLEVRFGVDATSAAAAKDNSYALEPGETMNITCTLHVKDIDDVRALNNGDAALDDVRILRVQDGRDHFITSHGIWLQSCFGLSVERLIRVPEEGVRSCPLDSSLEDQAVKWSAPRELFRLIEALEENLERTVADWDMKEEDGAAPWESAGWPFVASSWTITESRNAINLSIRESLDTGAAFSFAEDLSFVTKVETLAETLLIFLESLEGGIINGEMWNTLATSISEKEKTQKAIDPEALRALILEQLSISSARSVAFTFITFMLARTIREIAPVPVDAPVNVSAAAKATELFRGKLPRRSTGIEAQAAAKRRDFEKRFAEVFAGTLFKLPADAKAKEKRSAEERRRNIIAVFLPGNNPEKTL